MAINIPRAIFKDKKGVEYILKYGPKGNLRPYTIKKTLKLSQKILSKMPKNPYVIATIVIATVIIGTSLLIWTKSKENNSPTDANIEIL